MKDIDDLGWESVNALGFVRDPPVESLGRSGGANLRTEPQGDLIDLLPFGTQVRVLRRDKGWAAVRVTSSPAGSLVGKLGFVGDHLVWTNPPDPDAQLHAVQPGDGLQAVVEKHAPYQGYVRTGDDARSLVVAVYVANSADGRTAKNLRLNEAKLRNAGSWYDIFDSYRSETTPIFQSVELIGQNAGEERKIWLPGRSYVQGLRASGVIPTRAGWKNAAIEVGKGVGGFSVGLVEGFAKSIADVFVGAYELVKTILGVAKDLLTGKLLEQVSEIISTLKKMTIDELKQLAMTFVDALAGFVASSLKDFLAKWTQLHHYRKWKFRGSVFGYLLAEVAMLLLSGATVNAVKWLGKFGKIGGKLAKVVKALSPGDVAKLRPGKRPDIDMPEAPSKKSKPKDRDDGAGEKKQRELPVAMTAAAMIAEAHDEKDKPVPVVLAALAPLKARYRWIDGFGSRRRGPGKHQILMYASTHTVDKDYTSTPVEHEIPEGGVGAHERIAKGHKPPQWVEGNEDLVFFKDGHYQYRPSARPEKTGAPRLTKGEAFDPSKRRPRLSDYDELAPAGVERFDGGVRKRPDAQVSVWNEPLPGRVADRDRIEAALTIKDVSPKQRQRLGHDFESAVLDDHSAHVDGKGIRVEHHAGDKKRIGDVGRYEVTLEGQSGPFGDGKLDQLWRDLIDEGSVHLTVPKLDAKAQAQLQKLASVFEHVTGRTARIAVREVLPPS